MSTMTSCAVFCLYFLHHTHSLVSSCLFFTETSKKKKSKSPSSDHPTTFLPVPDAPNEPFDILEEDFSETEGDEGGFAQGHSQSQRVASKDPRVQNQQVRTESGKEKANRLRREEREEAFKKQRQLAQAQEDLARKRKHKSQSQDHLETSPRSTTGALSAFRLNKEQVRLENQPAGSDNEESSSDDEESDEEEASTNENHNPNIMGTSTTCNKTACKKAVKDAKDWKEQYDAEFQKNAQLTETNAQLNLQVAEQEKKLANVLQELKKAMKNASTLEFSQTVVDNLTTSAKNILFYKYQFALTEADQKLLARRLYYCMYIDKKTRDALGPTHMAQWIATYHASAGNAFAKERHFRNQQLQAVCRNYVKSGKDLPSVDLFEKVLMGKADLKDTDELEAVIFIWDKVAGAIAGQSNWGPNIRANNLMYTAKSQSDNEVSVVHLALTRRQFGCVLQLNPPVSSSLCYKTPIFGPAFRAFMYLLYRNRRDAWQSGGLLMRADPNFKIGKIPNKEKRRADPTIDLTPWQAEFTSNEDGNVDTGWKQAAFDVYKAKIQAFNKRFEDHEKEVLAFEKAALPLVKKAMEDETAGGPRRKRARVDIPKEKPVLSLDWSDNEDDAVLVDTEEV